MIDLSIVTVTYNSGHIIEAFIDALELASNPNCELIVVDSGSSDAEITERIVTTKGAKFVRSQVNVGYGTGSNLGAAVARGSWLVFVNPDVHLSTYDACELVEQAKALQISCLAPTVLDTQGREKVSWGRTITPPWRSRRRAFETTNDLVFAETVSGCCMTISAENFRALGGFDETFFMFCEEMDLHRRLGLQGGKIAVTKSVSVSTPGGASSQGVSDRWRLTERMVGHTNYMYKHFTKAEGHIAVLYNLSRILLLAAPSTKLPSLKQFFSGIRRHL